MTMAEHTLDVVARKLGLPSGAQLARELGRSPKSASRWRKEGIPRAVRYLILDYAARHGKKLTLADVDGYQCKAA